MVKLIKPIRRAAALAAALLLAACSMSPAPEPGPGPVPGPGTAGNEWERLYPVAVGPVRFAPAAFNELPATFDADWSAALTAFQKSCTKMAGSALWGAPCSAAAATNSAGARIFFENAFDIWRVGWVDNKDGRPDFKETGLATGYYEPMLRGSLREHAAYRWPLYGVPDDLIQVDLSELHPQLKGLRLRGKVVGRKLVPYDSREEIAAQGRSAGRRVLCWVDDPVEAFFLQIQGSGRILLDDGRWMRVGFGDQNGHPYKSLASWLIQNAGLKPSEMSMQRIKRWAAENPSRTQELLNANPNFVFFEERLGFADDDGPLGAQSVPLTPLASVAVDRRFWPLGLPFVIDVQQSSPVMDFVRPVVAQDTGGAIKGPLRFDYFWGYADAAGQKAGGQKSKVAAWVMLPKGSTPAQVLRP